jgi:hypothetical protein
MQDLRAARRFGGAVAEPVEEVPLTHPLRRETVMLIKRGRLALLLLVLWAPACTWVALTEEGADVQVRTPEQVKGCERKNRVNTAVTYKVGGMLRSEEKVREELRTLARNEAARLGGNAVVAETEPTDGRQVFVVYRCP